MRVKGKRLRTEVWLIAHNESAGGRGRMKEGSERLWAREASSAGTDSSSDQQLPSPAPHDSQGQAVLCLQEGPFLSASGEFPC